MNQARELLRKYCRPVNYLHLMQAIAIERGVHKSDIRALIDSGEYLVTNENGLTRKIIRRNPSFRPPISFNRGIDKHGLLAAIDAATVFSSELGKPLKDLKWQSLPCPFHEDGQPSFRVLLPEGGFHCLGCGESGGTVIDFAMKLRNLGFPEAINYLAVNYTSIRVKS